MDADCLITIATWLGWRWGRRRGENRVGHDLGRASRGPQPGRLQNITLDGTGAVHLGERGHDPHVRADRLRAGRVYGHQRFAANSIAIGTRSGRSTFPSNAPCPVLLVGAAHDQVVPTDE